MDYFKNRKYVTFCKFSRKHLTTLTLDWIGAANLIPLCDDGNMTRLFIFDSNVFDFWNSSSRYGKVPIANLGAREVGRRQDINILKPRTGFFDKVFETLPSIPCLSMFFVCWPDCPICPSFYFSLTNLCLPH